VPSKHKVAEGGRISVRPEKKFLALVIFKTSQPAKKRGFVDIDFNVSNFSSYLYSLPRRKFALVSGVDG